MSRSVGTAGDPPAPDPPAPDPPANRGNGETLDRAAWEEECEFYLRSLRDLEAERAAGDIGEADYQVLKDDYTARAAAVLRALSGEAPESAAGPAALGPATSRSPSPIPVTSGCAIWFARRAKSRRLAAHDGSGTAERGAPSTEGPAADPSRRRPRRLLITGAAVVLVLAGMGWAISGAVSPRAPGEVISGQAIGQAAVNQDLLAAAKAENHGDAVGAVKEYQAVLKLQPTNPQALTGEGWLLAQTQQPVLLREGLGMLQDAERVAPSYLPPHVYRGIALLSEGDNAGAIPELQYYLAHHPDPRLTAKVAQALAAAQAAVAAGHASRPPAG